MSTSEPAGEVETARESGRHIAERHVDSVTMRRGMWLLAVCLALVAVGAGISAAQPAPRATVAPIHVTVRPALGSRGTRFLVRFPALGGSVSASSLERHYFVTAAGPRRRGCLAAAAATATTATPGGLESARLVPRQGHWCLGTFHGRVSLLLTPICTGPMRACPMFVIAVGVVGRFTFRVR